MTVVFEGKSGVDTYRAIALKNALLLYVRTGMKMNRMWTPKNMMALASQITETKFKARDYVGAVNELEVWLAINGTNGSHPVTQTLQDAKDAQVRFNEASK